ncbi:DUF624 domain-containing protein [Gracilibacillus alcaliphilus]|uniref:YesL family protein n=1 Tax=Gracilibacillus alcaliphilus TaxID=1401441 RepID=UPI00195A73F3|nr:YesL family protein [Gracilibacillus alcaliphilus]MBM7675566.1 putative membrane protein YesL [Gracilibacillus alcaliphilus]
MSQLLSLDSPLMKLLARMVDMVMLNTLFLICCIPIITLGASLTSLYYVLLKMVRGEDLAIVSSFFRAFQRNFKQSTIVWVFLLVLNIILLVNAFSLGIHDGLLKVFYMGMLLFLGTLSLSVFLFIFPYIARFQDTIKQSLINSVMISWFHMRYFFLLLVMNVLPVILVLFSVKWLIIVVYFVTFGGIALIVWLNAHILNKIFAVYEKRTA